MFRRRRRPTPRPALTWETSQHLISDRVKPIEDPADHRAYVRTTPAAAPVLSAPRRRMTQAEAAKLRFYRARLRAQQATR